MHRVLTFIILAVILSVSVPLSLYAKEQRVVIQEFTQRIHGSSVPVESSTLQDIATEAYDVLIHVPFTGLRRSQAEIDDLIFLKNMLMTHSGMLEQLLALRMQQAIDCALLAEVNRRAMFFNGEAVVPSYKPDSIDNDDMVTSLFKSNAISEGKQIQYILGLNGELAHFCQRKNWDVEEILTGKIMRSLSADMEKVVAKAQSLRNSPQTMDEKTMRDFLFVSSLEAIDRQRDIRILWDVFLEEKNFYLTGTINTKTENIQNILASQQYRYYISTGQKKKSWMIASSGAFCHTPTFPSHYPTRLSIFFFPYFKDMRTIAVNNPGIFSWLCESKGVELEKLLQSEEGGVWLKLKE